MTQVLKKEKKRQKKTLSKWKIMQMKKITYQLNAFFESAPKINPKTNYSESPRKKKQN